MAGAYRISNKHLRKAMLKAFKGKCFYTGQEVTEDNMAIDHVIPRSRGGEDTIYNYVLTTRSLNGQKSAALDENKLKSILYLVKTVYAPRVDRILNGKDKNTPIQIPWKVYQRFKELKNGSIYVYLILLELNKNADIVTNGFLLSYQCFKEKGIPRSSFKVAMLELSDKKFIRINGNYSQRVCTLL